MYVLHKNSTHEQIYQWYAEYLVEMIYKINVEFCWGGDFPWYFIKYWKKFEAITPEEGIIITWVKSSKSDWSFDINALHLIKDVIFDGKCYAKTEQWQKCQALISDLHY